MVAVFNLNIIIILYFIMSVILNSKSSSELSDSFPKEEIGNGKEINLHPKPREILLINNILSILKLWRFRFKIF